MFKQVFRLIRQIHPEVKLRDFLSLVMQYLYVVRGENEYIDIEKIARQEIPEEEEYMGTMFPKPFSMAPAARA